MANKRRAVSARMRPKQTDRPVPELKSMMNRNPNDTYEPKTAEEKLLTHLMRPDR